MAVSRVSQSSVLQGFPKSRSLLAGNSAYIPSSFESIATATPTSGTTVTFSSIPSTYKALQIRVNIIDNSVPALLVQLNGATSYAIHALRADGGTVSATGNTAQTYIYGASTWTQPSTLRPLVGIIDIQDYASTSKNKTVRILSGQNNNAGATAEEIKLSSGLWISTSAVNSVSIITSGAYSSGTSIALYGIKG